MMSGVHRESWNKVRYLVTYRFRLAGASFGAAHFVVLVTRLDRPDHRENFSLS
jgi:hypothetical protein